MEGPAYPGEYVAEPSELRAGSSAEGQAHEGRPCAGVRTQPPSESIQRRRGITIVWIRPGPAEPNFILPDEVATGLDDRRQ